MFPLKSKLMLYSFRVQDILDLVKICMWLIVQSYAERNGAVVNN